MTKLRNLEWADGQSNPSGIKSTSYYIRRSHVKKWPKFFKDPTTVAEEVSYDGDIEPIEGESFISIYSTQGVGKVDFEFIGEKDCEMALNKAMLSYPDMNDEGIAYARSQINSNGVLIVPTYTAGGKIAYVTIGGEDFDPTIKVKGTSGDKPGSQKGLTIDAEAPDFYPLPRYTGLIKLENGTLNCATGEFTAKE